MVKTLLQDIRGAQESTKVNKLVFITLSNLVKRMQGRTPVIGIVN